MRIWIANHYAAKPAQAGGTRHYALAKYMARLGHDVWILASAFEHHSHQQAESLAGQSVSVEEVDGVKFVWLRTAPYSENGSRRILNILSFAGQLASCLLRRIPRPDVILGSTPHLLTPLVAYGMSRFFGVPFALEVRDLWPKSFVDLGILTEAHPAVRAMARAERYLYRKSQLIVTLLPGSEAHIAAHGATRDKIHWIPNGIDLELVGAPRLPPEVDDRKLVVMYAGAHGFANALDSLLDTAKLLRDDACGIVFRFVGAGTERSRLIERVQTERLANVEFLPPVPKRQVYDVLFGSDVLFASLRRSALYESGISLNKIFDYMAVARPIVFGSDAAYDPVGQSGGGITVEPENATAMANAILRIASLTRSERCDMGARGRRYVAEHYDMKALAARLSALLTAM